MLYDDDNGLLGHTEEAHRRVSPVIAATACPSKRGHTASLQVCGSSMSDSIKEIYEKLTELLT